MLQLNPPLPLQTEKGWGWAHRVTWNSLEHSLYWTVFFMPDTGECWMLPNEKIRAMKNITGERVEHPKF